MGCVSSAVHEVMLEIKNAEEQLSVQVGQILVKKKKETKKDYSALQTILHILLQVIPLP